MPSTCPTKSGSSNQNGRRSCAVESGREHDLQNRRGVRGDSHLYQPAHVSIRLHPGSVELEETLAHRPSRRIGRSGLYIEIKSPELYDGIERLILSELESKGLARPGADPRTPVLLQSFSESSLRIFAATLGTKLPIHFLVAARDAAPWLTAEGLTKLQTFATGFSPEKVIVTEQPDAVARLRQAGLLVTPCTFRASAVTGYPDVRAEMAHYLQDLGVDGVITDNPDQMPPPTARR